MMAGKKLRIASAQLNHAGSITRNLAKIEAAVARARRNRADAILFPECALTGYAIDWRGVRPGDVRAGLRDAGAIAKAHGIHVLLGAPIILGRKRFNGMVVFDRGGRPTHAYAKCQLTAGDRESFSPGDAVSLFEIDGVPSTSIICHERRYPELVRLPVMMGARVLFHPNAGLDALAVSRSKRGGRDGVVSRAFENAIYYVFANTVGPQGGGRWSAGDSKIVAPDMSTLAWAGNRGEAVVVATVDLSQATGRYALDMLKHPRFLVPGWRRMLRDARRRAGEASQVLIEAIGF
ncbi:MAG TPA: nitrilase-related carbon-nitrogen hydrolase [Verrucomicrobiae bacterium]|nr:nitrilase-related carbon-nitrogen hydrolase [Verrucomicrobiae bacterium]